MFDKEVVQYLPRTTLCLCNGQKALSWAVGVGGVGGVSRRHIVIVSTNIFLLFSAQLCMLCL